MSATARLLSRWDGADGLKQESPVGQSGKQGNPDSLQPFAGESDISIDTRAGVASRNGNPAQECLPPHRTPEIAPVLRRPYRPVMRPR